MFGGFGDTLKNLTNQVQKEVEDLAIEKKKEAQTMLESQVKKTGDALMNTKAGVEKSACDAKKSAIDGFDKECSAAEQGAEGAVKETKQATVEAGAAAGEAAGAAKDAVAGALGGVESQINSAVGGAVQQVGQVVDAKIKEADHFLDEKREEVVRQVRGATDKATGQAEEGVGAVLGKAKGLFNL